MAHTRPNIRPFTSHQRLQALERVLHHPTLDAGARDGLRVLWGALWEAQASGRLLWTEPFQRNEVGGEHLSASFPGVGLQTLVNGWRSVAGLPPISPNDLDSPSDTLTMATSILIPAETVVETIGIASTCAWYPPIDWWQEGNLVFLLRWP